MSTTTSAELKNIDPVTLEVPETRIETGLTAHSIAKRLEDTDRDASVKRASVDGMFDGNPPYSTSKLKKLQQAYRANFNPREAEAILEQKHIPYYDLLSETPELVEVELKAGDVYQRDRWGRTLAQHFSTLVREWPEWEAHMQMAQLQMLRHGLGPVFFEDKTSWKFKALKRSQIMFPPFTSVACDKWSVVAVRAQYALHELMDKIRNPDAAKKMGWNPDNVKDAMANAQPADTNQEAVSGQAEQVQREVRENHFWSSTSVVEQVDVYKVYWKEFDGKISWCIVPRTAVSNEENQSADKLKDVALMVRRDDYDTWDNLVQVLTSGIGDGTMNGIYGLGKKIFPHIQVNTRLLCQLVDNAFLSSTILVQRGTDADREGANLVQAGPLSILPTGYTIQTGQIFSDPSRGMEVKSHLSNILVANTGHNDLARPSTPGNKRDVRTATEIESEDAKHSRIGRNEINRFYSQADRLYREMFRRALTSNDEDAKDFRLSCEMDGVPLGQLRSNIKVFKVSAMRAVGNGSFLQRRHIFRELIGNSHLFDERGRYNIKEDYVASLVGQSKVARYLAPRDQSEEVTADHSFAVLENAAMKSGAPALVVDTHWHVPHMQVHLKAATDAINALQGQEDNTEMLAEVANFMMIIGPHMGQHMNFIQADPSRENEYKILVQQFTQVANMADEVLNMYQQKMQSQASVQGEEQAEGGAVDTARNQMNFEAEKHKQQLQHREEEHQQKLRLKAEEQEATNATRTMGNQG